MGEHRDRKTKGQREKAPTAKPTNELTLAVTVCTGPGPDEANQHPSTDVGGDHGFPPIYKELLAMDGYKDKAGEISSGMQPLRDCPWWSG